MIGHRCPVGEHRPRRASDRGEPAPCRLLRADHAVAGPLPAIIAVAPHLHGIPLSVLAVDPYRRFIISSDLDPTEAERWDDLLNE